MKPRRLLAALLVSACTTGLLPSVNVEAESICSTDPHTSKTVCMVVAAPAYSVTLAGSTLRWARVDGLTRFGQTCQRVLPDGTIEIGVSWYVTLVDTTTSALVYGRTFCQWTNDPVPSPPPDPPSPGEFADAARKALLVEPLSAPSAAFGGITGLDTWLWCEHPAQVQVSVSLRGWTAQADVALTSVSFTTAGTEDATTGDGSPYRPSTCGSSTRPAALWLPDRKGGHSIVLAATWAGAWTLSFNGQFTTAPLPLGPVVLTSPTVAYSVREVRGLLVTAPPTP